MKTLCLEELLELAGELGLTAEHIAERRDAIEKSAAALAVDCAEVLRVRHAMTALDEAGLCSSFVAKHDGDLCPEQLRRFDPHGSFHAGKGDR